MVPRRELLIEETTSRILLRGFARSVAEIEWLVLVLTMFQAVVLGDAVRDRIGLVGGMVGYAMFLLLHRYAGGGWRASRAGLALECAAMFIFITWSLYSAGPAGASLVNLHLLVIVVAALTLGRLPTATLLFAVALTLFGLDFAGPVPTLGIAWSGVLGALIPFALVAWVTTLLASDLAFTHGMARDWFATDELTALPTLHQLNKALASALRRAMNVGRPCSVMLVDLDNLKTINDTHGHAAGNLVLRSVADTLTGMARATDTSARIGGDEFAVVLPDTSVENAIQVAGRVLERVLRQEIRIKDAVVRPSVSIGVATFPQHADSADALLKAADLALYAAKRDGRGRIAQARMPGDPANGAT